MKILHYSIIIFSSCLVFLFSSPEQILADDVPTVSHLIPLGQNKKPFLNFTADGSVDTVKISENGRYVAAGTQASDKKGSVYFFDNNGTLLWNDTVDRQILQVAISYDGKYLAAAGSQFYHFGTYGPAGWNNGEIYYFDNKGNLLWDYNGTGSVAVTNVAISSDGSYVAVGSDKAILYFDKNGHLLWTYPVTRSNDHTVSISPDGSYVVTKDDAVVEFLDNHGNQLWSYTAGHGTEENVSAGSSYLTMSTDGRYVITSDYADGILLFDDKGKIILAKNTGHHFYYQSISYDGSFIVANAQQWGDSDPGATYLFDKNGTILWSYSGDMKSAISGNGRYVLGSTWYNGPTLYFLDDKGNLLWNSNSRNVNSIDVSYDGTLSVVGTGFGNNNDEYILFFNQNTIDVTESQPVVGYVKKGLDTPLQQFQSGIAAKDVKCKEGLHLVIRYQTLEPLCIKFEHINPLVQRGAFLLLFANDNHSSEFSVDGIKNSYDIGQPINFTVKFKGNSPGCTYPRVYITDSDRRIVWTNPTSIMQCNQEDTGIKYREMNWQIGQDQTLHMDRDSGWHNVVVSWNNNTYTKEFWVNSLVSKIIIPKGFSENKADFEPQSAVIKMGVNNTVQWINEDTSSVDIISDDGTDDGFYDLTHLYANSSTLLSGQNLNYSFGGDFKEIIRYHDLSGHNGSITVIPRDTQLTELQIQHPSGNRYSNDHISVAKGTWVSWENIDNATHTITSDDGKSFDSGLVKPRMRFTLDTAHLSPGYYDYHDSLNSVLRGSIRVVSPNENDDKTLIKMASGLNESKLFLEKYPDAVIRVQHNYFDSVDFMLGWTTSALPNTFGDTRTLELEVSFDKDHTMQNVSIGCLGPISAFDNDVIGSINSGWCTGNYTR